MNSHWGTLFSFTDWTWIAVGPVFVACSYKEFPGEVPWSYYSKAGF